MLEKFSELTKNLGLGLALAFGLVYSTYIGTRSMERIRGTVDVKGYAERKVKADVATWRVSVRARDEGLADAMHLLDERSQKLKEYLSRHEIASDEISEDMVSKTYQYKRTDKGRITNKIEAYVVERAFDIKSSDVEKIKDLSLKISELNLQGGGVTPQSPRYLLDREKLEKVKIELLAEATKAARSRADQFAENSGTRIGRLVSAHQGVFQVTTENATDVNDYGTYDTTSIDKIVKIVVTLSYTTGS